MINKPNYEGRTPCKNYQTAICFFTKKQMKRLYPNKNYRVVGEINSKTGVHSGTVDNLDHNPLPVYKIQTHNKLTESVVGYAAVDDNIYLAVVKNVLLKRIMISIIGIAVIVLLYAYIFMF